MKRKYKYGDNVKIKKFNLTGIVSFSYGAVKYCKNKNTLFRLMGIKKRIPLYLIKVGESVFWCDESQLENKKIKRVFSEIDPYGEEDWEV